MKKLKYLCSAFLVGSLLAIPAAAQKHPMGHRNNGFGQPHGQAHAKKDKDKDNDKGKHNPDRDKGKGKALAKGETQGQHNGHREH